MSKKKWGTALSACVLSLVVGCGKNSSPNTQGLIKDSIVGGQFDNGSKQKYSSVVSIFSAYSGGVCTASLIEAKALMTAEHCLFSELSTLNVLNAEKTEIVGVTMGMAQAVALRSFVDAVIFNVYKEYIGEKENTSLFLSKLDLEERKSVFSYALNVYVSFAASSVYVVSENKTADEFKKLIMSFSKDLFSGKKSKELAKNRLSVKLRDEESYVSKLYTGLAYHFSDMRGQDEVAKPVYPSMNAAISGDKAIIELSATPSGRTVVPVLASSEVELLPSGTKLIVVGRGSQYSGSFLKAEAELMSKWIGESENGSNLEKLMANISIKKYSQNFLDNLKKVESTGEQKFLKIDLLSQEEGVLTTAASSKKLNNNVLFTAPGEGVCQGDSGGPLFVQVKSADTGAISLRQVGVSSRVVPSCQSFGYHTAL